MQDMNVHDMIYFQMNHFITKTINQNSEITLSKLVEIASWVSAYTIRQRHLQNGSISEDEMQMVLGAVGNFGHENFPDAFTQEQFAEVSAKALELLKTPTFDEDAPQYFGQYYR
ncbi:hypothetical protein [Chryseobacterium sp. MFBS3-17]|uniref:hypothetical protein n=1 Tax=Chryseobacterium sp. MFBS3-17 TaxID=2886689 RepID=UPI001D0F110A|nr:hypothetical protein [Chryseobacterium sp. MFBS3-17]MCC2590465.1 hypothetical protein [Chryseobacterium sp. MFBS3-17]